MKFSGKLLAGLATALAQQVDDLFSVKTENTRFNGHVMPISKSESMGASYEQTFIRREEAFGLTTIPYRKGNHAHKAKSTKARERHPRLWAKRRSEDQSDRSDRLWAAQSASHSLASPS